MERLKTPGKLISVLIIFVILIFISSACTGPAGAQGPAGPTGPAGVGIASASVNDGGHLVLTLSNGQTIDAGSATVSQSTPATSRNTITMGDLFTLLQPVIVRVDVVTPGLMSSGSGVIIRKDGYVITNEHVIHNASSINIALSDNQQYSAAVTYSDSNVDLAILKLTNSPANLSEAVLGSVSDISIGGVVVAAGYPFGPDLPGPASFSQGIISSVRSVNGQSYIQSDVQINTGNSGGALVNRSNGKVIGITSARLVSQGQYNALISLAIPIDIVQKFIQDNLT